MKRFVFLIVMLLIPNIVRAQSVGVMAVRAGEAGAVSQNALSNLTLQLWQSVTAVPGVQAVAEPQLAGVLGPASKALATCARDDCMAVFGQQAGLDRVVYAVAQAHPKGFQLHVRVVQVNPPALLSQNSPACSPCNEGGLVVLLSQMQMATMLSSGAPAPGPKGGSLTLSSKPAGATVLLGKSTLGVTPLKKVALPEGSHVLMVGLEGYQPARVEVSVGPGKHVRKRVSLKRVPPSTGRLTLTSKPPGAVVELRGQQVGTTPIEGVDLPPGPYPLTVKLPGHQPLQLELKIVAGKSVKRAVRLKLVPKTAGAVSITSEPPGAQVTGANGVWGKTPLALPGVPVGPHALTLTLPGYQPSKRTLKVLGKGTAKLKVKLDPFAALTVSATGGGKPIQATVKLDGQGVGTTPLSLKEVVPGRHQIEVAAPGFRTESKRLTLRAGKQQDIALALLPESGTLSLTSEPSGATVRAGQMVVGTTPIKRKTMAIGQGQLRLSLEGYFDAPLDVQILDKKNSKYHARLKPKPATLKIVATAGGQALAGANVMVAGKVAGVTPAEIKAIEPGRVVVAVSRPGLVPVKKTVTLEPGKTAEVSIALEVALGTVRLLSQPAGARVFIAGSELGVTPLKALKLPAGEHTLDLKKDGFLPGRVVARVVHGKTAQRSVKLVPLPPTLVVQSQPPGATVLVDGKAAGTTPFRSTGLSVGSHTVALELPGHTSVKRSVQLQKQKVTTVTEELQARLGTLRATSVPPGAVISIDGTAAGQTPAAALKVIIGSHTVGLQLEGYEAASREIVIAEGRTKSVSVTLKAKPASLSVRTTPAGASVSLDSKEVGVAPLTLEDLTPGDHIIDLGLDAHQPVRRTVNIKPGSQESLEVPLQLTPEAASRVANAEARQQELRYAYMAWGVSALTAIAGTTMLFLHDQKAAELHASVDVYNRYIQSDQLLDVDTRNSLAADIEDADLALRDRPDDVLGGVSAGVAVVSAAAGAWLYLMEPLSRGNSPASVTFSPFGSVQATVGTNF